MRAILSALLLSLLLFGLGCSTDRVEDTEGAVILSVSDFNGLATRFSVNGSGGVYEIGEIEITNFPKNPRGNTSDLMNVEMQTYEVVFTRADTGTRLPPVMVRNILGFAPIGGTLRYENLPMMGLDQLDNPPLDDLLFANGAFDKETGAQLITLNLTLRFFGRTISGNDVATDPVSFTVEFVP